MMTAHIEDRICPVPAIQMRVRVRERQLCLRRCVRLQYCGLLSFLQYRVGCA